MAWNPSPKVAAARDLGAQFNKCMVIVFMVEYTEGHGGTLEYASWGDNAARCAEAQDLADVAYKAMMNPEERE